MMVDNSPADFFAKNREKARRARWAATEAWRKHFIGNRSEFLRTIAQVASEESHEIDGTSHNGERRRRLDKFNPLPSEGRGHKFEILSARFQRVSQRYPSRHTVRKHRGSKRREVIGQIVALTAALSYAVCSDE